MELTAVLQVWWGPGRPDLMGGCRVTAPADACPHTPGPAGLIVTASLPHNRCTPQDLSLLFPQDPSLGKGEI